MLSEKLKNLRRQCCLTQKQVADSLGINRSTYAYYETGKTTPDVTTLKRLADIYGVGITELFSTGGDTALFSDNESSYQVPERPVLVGNLDRAEKRLLLLFRQLGDAGKAELIKRAETAVEKAMEE